MDNDPLSVTFAALADPTRRAILARLATGEATVNELAEPFDMSLQAVSKHLKVLEHAGLISRGRNAQYRPCRLESEALDGAVDWIERHRRIWTDRFDRLEQHLKDIQRAEPNDPSANEQEGEQAMSEGGAQTGEVTYERIYKAPRELVFRCMIEPEHLAHFWGPIGMTTPVENIRLDPRPGGVFETDMVNDESGEVYPMKAVYVEIVEPERISFTRARASRAGCSPPSRSPISATARTEVVTHQTNVPEMYMSAEAQAGMQTSFDKFEAYVTSL